MKKAIPFVAFLFLIGCNNEPAAADAVAKDNAQNKDTTAIIKADSIETRVDTIAETVPVMIPPPPPPAKKAAPANNEKSSPKSKAKIDSIAIREANKLPLDQ